MASKKYSFLTGVLCLLASFGFSQTTTTTRTGTVGTSYDITDSSVIPSRRLPQYTEFLNGTYNYPAKPRNQWEVGIKGGAFNVSGHVASIFPTPGFGVHVRKAFGYVFSLRLEYMYGIGKGLNYVASSGYLNNAPWIAAGYTPPNSVYYNYRTHVQDLSLEGVFALNNIRFHKSGTGVSFYGFAGIAGMIYDTRINIRNAAGGIYDFSGINGNVYKNRKATRDALKKLMDNTYETPALSEGVRRPKLFGQTFRPVGNLGVGVAFKLSNRVNLAIEDRFTITKDQYIDGEPYQEHPASDPALAGQHDAYNYATVGLNFNLGSKSVQPLWWLNPLDYAYQEIRKPRMMILPKPVLPDADGDGVTDQFDMETTPAGCPVDTHGVSLDTDGDGVPDCRDKEKITPTYCQPVDADGVGKCPCPDSSCFAKYKMMQGGECAANLGSLPSVTFGGSGFSLNNDAKGLLASIAARMRQNGECKIVVTSYCASSKAEQQRSWDRVNAVINYLVEKEGISQDRFFWQIGQQGGDCNTVDFRAAGDADMALPTTIPAPHPNLSRGKK
ncbi:MAG: hypothetical protein NVS9B7_29450 [Flavisolibacter sp.]